MAEQMLNVSNRSTSTQQTSGKRFSEIVRGNVCTGLTVNFQPSRRSIGGGCGLVSIVASENEFLRLPG
jgi:hypothetical protein